MTKHRTVRTALKYGAASSGKEYTPGNDHVGFNWISRKPIKMSRGLTDKGAKRRLVELPAVHVYSRYGVRSAVFRGVWLLTTPDRTGRHRTALDRRGPYQAENDWLFHFDDCYE